MYYLTSGRECFRWADKKHCRRWRSRSNKFWWQATNANIGIRFNVHIWLNCICISRIVLLFSISANSITSWSIFCRRLTSSGCPWFMQCFHSTKYRRLCSYVWCNLWGKFQCVESCASFGLLRKILTIWWIVYAMRNVWFSLPSLLRWLPVITAYIAFSLMVYFTLKMFHNRRQAFSSSFWENVQVWLTHIAFTASSVRRGRGNVYSRSSIKNLPTILKSLKRWAIDRMLLEYISPERFTIYIALCLEKRLVRPYYVYLL